MSANKVEKLVYWYLRFNGYLTVENFTVHPDHKKNPEAEFDFLAVRFPFSQENPENFPFKRDKSIILPPPLVDFVVMEVKTGRIDFNKKSLFCSDRQNFEYILKWLGFLQAGQICCVAEELRKHLRWSDGQYSVRFICAGGEINDEFKDEYPDLLQLTLKNMMSFILTRLTTNCHARHRENWDKFMNDLINIMAEDRDPDKAIRWILSID